MEQEDSTEDGFGYCSLAEITQICMLSADEKRVQRIFEAQKNSPDGCCDS